MRTLALILALAPAVATAAPGTQLQRLVDQGFREYRIDAEASQLTTAQASAIYLLVTSPGNDYVPADAHVRQQINAILRWEDATNPDLR